MEIKVTGGRELERALEGAGRWRLPRTVGGINTLRAGGRVIAADCPLSDRRATYHQQVFDRPVVTPSRPSRIPQTCSHVEAGSQWSAAG